MNGGSKSRIPTPTVDAQSTQDGYTKADRAHVAALYPIVADAIASELYYPRRTSNLCGRRYCAHWRTCEAEYGRAVRD
jgi:hypothetical protein